MQHTFGMSARGTTASPHPCICIARHHISLKGPLSRPRSTACRASSAQVAESPAAQAAIIKRVHEAALKPGSVSTAELLSALVSSIMP